MEDLFSTNIAVNKQNVNYRVVFDNDRYVFLSDTGKGGFRSFSFKREHDEWHDQESLPTDIKNQATEALDNYLLRQH